MEPGSSVEKTLWPAQTVRTGAVISRVISMIIKQWPLSHRRRGRHNSSELTACLLHFSYDTFCTIK
uniref:Uncharacterized protein n=1 Tax=Anguilla anguilla TaxID=7936 RepID=A0A0E9UY95_ANGAN